MPVNQNDLDFARPPEIKLTLKRGIKCGAAAFYPPLLQNINNRAPSEVEVRYHKIW